MDVRRITSKPAYSPSRLTGEDRVWHDAVAYVRNEYLVNFWENLKYDLKCQNGSVTGALMCEFADRVARRLDTELEADLLENVIAVIDHGDYPTLGDDGEEEI